MSPEFSAVPSSFNSLVKGFSLVDEELLLVELVELVELLLSVDVLEVLEER